jgi:hypothetical protein
MTTIRVRKLAKGYRYVPSDRVPACFGHVVGPTFGQVYEAQKTPQGYVVTLAGVGVGHFRQHHPSGQEV